VKLARSAIDTVVPAGSAATLRQINLPMINCCSGNGDNWSARPAADAFGRDLIAFKIYVLALHAAGFDDLRQ
jgi:hypothetical protein